MRVVTPVTFSDPSKLHTRRVQSTFSEVLEETIKKAYVRQKAGYMQRTAL